MTEAKLFLYLQEFCCLSRMGGMAPSGAKCLGLRSRTAVPQEYFGCISPSPVLFGALAAQVGALDLPREKRDSS